MFNLQGDDFFLANNAEKKSSISKQRDNKVSTFSQLDAVRQLDLEIKFHFKSSFYELH